MTLLRTAGTDERGEERRGGGRRGGDGRRKERKGGESGGQRRGEESILGVQTGTSSIPIAIILTSSRRRQRTSLSRFLGKNSLT